MKVVFLTAGAAGMYCGSCMHDNALAREMRRQGADCLLQPVYTPIRTDSKSVADDQVFFGGINIYLLQQMPWLRRVPRVIRGVLDWPPLIGWATKRAHSTDASKLGRLSVSMLKGKRGRQRVEVKRFVDWLETEIKPDAIVLSNFLIGGAIPEIRRRLPDIRVSVVLQGDDIFLDHLMEPYREQAIKCCQDLVCDVDDFIVNSRFYADKMGGLMKIPDQKLHVHPLSIDLAPFQDLDEVQRTENEFRLGYFARIAPEKGLHFLVDAFIELASKPEHQDLTLHAGGWLGAANQDYFQTLKDRLASAGLAQRFTYHESPDLEGKVNLVRSFDVLCVPTEYEEPKGLFVLESLAAGVPVVQPNHGAFPELIESTQGGLLFDAGSKSAFCEQIVRIKSDDATRKSLAEHGGRNVREKHSIEIAAQRLMDLLSSQ